MKFDVCRYEPIVELKFVVGRYEPIVLLKLLVGKYEVIVELKLAVCKKEGSVVFILFTEVCILFILFKSVFNLVDIVLEYVEVGKYEPIVLLKLEVCKKEGNVILILFTDV